MRYSSDWLISFFVYKHKTAYEMRISDWSSDVCSSDLVAAWIKAKGENMLTERRNAANEVAAKLFEAEAAIDHAIVAIGALASAMPQAQAAAKLTIGRAKCRASAVKYV